MGRLQPRVAWDQIYIARSKGWPPLSVPTGNTHAPGPSGMPTRCSRYLPPWPLFTVCARKGVDNLVNRTLPTAGTSGSMKQVWGLPEQDSIYGRLRRFKYSLHDQHTNLYFIQQTESPLIIPDYAIPDTSVSTKTGDKLVSTQDRGFPGFLLIGMKGIRG